MDLRTLLPISLLFAGAAVADTLPTSNHRFVTEHFTGSGVCSDCHNGISDENGKDVSLERSWKTSMMANAARDPFWQAKVASEIKRNPHLESELDHTCTRCHAPMANVEAEAGGHAIGLFINKQIDPAHPNFDAAMDGVSCTLCHQIREDENFGEEEDASGHFSIDLDNRVAYGPKPSPFANPMRMNTGFEPVYSKHIQTSEICASCHDLKTPFVDENGDVVDPATAHGGFQEQMVYREWENSAYAPGKRLEKNCQDCHMPETDGAPLSNRPRWLPTVRNFSQHTFLGGNTVMMKIIDANSKALGATNADFTPAIKRNRAFVRQAAKLTVEKQSIEAGKLTVRLAVRNLSGHKLPTGYPSRRVYLHFLVKDKKGATVFESGRMRADGSIVGVNSDNRPGTYEPHHNVISKPGQVLVYESIMADTEDNVMYTLLKASDYLKDNRLLPAGLNKRSAPYEVAVHGRALTDPNFNFANDRITYSIALPDGASGDTYSVTATLRYQPLAYAFLRDLFEDDELPAVASFKKMYESSSLRSEVIARKSFTIAR